jgi:GC-rich sequence DNA-binding factor
VSRVCAFKWLPLFRIADNPNGSHAAFANRQFWACFKLFRNILSWQGLMTDEILSDLALNAVLNRYLLIALGVNPNSADALTKSKQIVAVLPSEWKERGSAREHLKRLANYLASLGNSLSGQREAVNEVFSLLKVIGYGE